MTIKLLPSRIMLLMCTSCHVLAALIPWAISLPLCLSGLLLPALMISLLYHVCRIQLCLPDSIVALELDGEECRALLRDSDINLSLHGEAWCSPLIQILYFSRDSKSPGQRGMNQKCYMVRAIIRKIPRWPMALFICADSCTAEQQRQLRKFLRWRVVC